MSEAITVQCPACKASLKLKSRSAVGKKVPCPKCKKPFVVKAPPPESEDELAFLNASESDGAMATSPEEEEELAEEAAPSRPSSRSSAGRKKGKSKSGPPVNWVKPLLICLVAIAAIGLLVGGGMVAVSMIGDMVKNKIDLAYLPPDAELVGLVRVDEVLASPIMQSFAGNAQVKQGLDKLSDVFLVPTSDIKSITFGAANMSEMNFMSDSPLPGLALPEIGMPLHGGARRQSGPTAPPKPRGVIVVRTLKETPADFLATIAGLEATAHQGQTYYRPKSAVPGQPQLKMPTYRATATVLVLGDESEIQRIIEKGGKQTRRPEFDFIETSPHIILATLGGAVGDVNAPAAQPAASPAGHSGGMHGQPAVGMPAGMNAIPGVAPGQELPPGVAPTPMLQQPAVLASLSGGKLKGSYFGITFTQDIDFQSGLNCPESANEARAELEQSVKKLKTDFAAQKDKLAALSMLGLGDAIPIIESIVNSVTVAGTGPVVQITAKIPGSIKTVFDKAGPAMMGLTGMGGAGSELPAGPGSENAFGAPSDADAFLGDQPGVEIRKVSADAPTGAP
jgi:hypothetical protein